MDHQELEVLRKYQAVQVVFRKTDRQFQVALVGCLLSILVIVLGLRLLDAAERLL